ncbi:unnamed protein product [Staurois parvus]|uniref:Uncharacterized protein n=1 Tax=Staurois parvus TaxID=386267 RepID=A0ABN9ESH5_9NEOB|nr:unnamed protein product [Staurois parvus]
MHVTYIGVMHVFVQCIQTLGLSDCTRGGLTIWKLGHCPRAPGSVGGPMRCPWYIFLRLF